MGVFVECRFCNNLDQTIVCHEVDEPIGEFRLATTTHHAVSFPVVSWEVEGPTDPDVAVGCVHGKSLIQSSSTIRHRPCLFHVDASLLLHRLI